MMTLRKITQSKAQARLTSVGQATTELAVFGTIILVIFAALLRYGSTYSTKQEAQMYAFRKAAELAKLRHDGVTIPGEHQGGILGLLGGYQFHIPFLPIGLPWGSRKFASADLSVQKNAYPVNPFNPESVQEPSSVDASASVHIETEGGNFGVVGEPATLDDIPGAYYQVGDTMIKKNEYFQPGYIYVMRESSDKVPRHPWDGVFDLLDGSDEKDSYIALQPVPYREVEQYTQTVASNQYRANEEAGRPAYTQDSVTQTVSETIYHPPGNDPITLTLMMKMYDPKVIAALTLWAEDMNVTTTQTLTKDRRWTTQ